MATSIPRLTDATTVNAADELIIQQSGITKRATATELAVGIDANIHNQGNTGFHATDNPPGKIWRFKDRVFIGDAADFTGNQASGTSYGPSWAMSESATYFYLNSVFAAAGASQARGGVGPSSAGVMGISKWMGVGAVAVNDGSTYNTARALYAEGMHYNADTGTTVTAEFQCGNYNGTTLPVAHAYNMGGSRVNGIQVAAESGRGYLQGSTAPGVAIITPTQPCGAAIDIAGGVDGETYQRFVVGIVFRNGGLNRATFGGTPNVGVAASMAMNHQFNWAINSRGTVGSFIRGDVTGASACSGLKLKNLGAAFVGADYERVICDFRDDAGDARTTDSIVGNGTIATAITSAAHNYSNGDVVFINDAAPSGFNGTHTVTVVDATTFTFPSSVNATATTQALISRNGRNYLQIRNHRTANAPAIHAEGIDTNIDINFVTKGTGYIRMGTHAAVTTETVSGFITIRDSAGTLRKLAVVS